MGEEPQPPQSGAKTLVAAALAFLEQGETETFEELLKAHPAEAEAVRALLADPALAAKLSNPRVRAALQEVAQNPLKAVKYVFDAEVREALAAARRLMSGKT